MRKNLHYKLVALFLSFVLWVFVQGEQILEINRKILVRLKVPEGYIIQGNQVRYKDATLQGPRSLLGDFPTTPIEAEITLSNESLGKSKYRIDKEYIHTWDPRIKLTVHEAYITVFLDNKVSKSVKIEAQIQGTPNGRYLIERVSTKPTKVTITGAAGVLRQIKKIQTNPININGIKKDQNFKVFLSLLAFHNVETSVSEIDVFVKLKEIGEKP